MLTEYWNCKWHDFDSGWDGEEEHPTYGCTHPFGIKECPIENKYGDKEDCVLLDIEKGKLPPYK